jgi:tRNA-specific 2-thiouridylase
MNAMSDSVKSAKNKKIFVGLSGGVDSAVSAALLKEAGAEVTGVFIKGWYPPEMPCTWREDRQDAMRVAAKLQIPFITLDASTEYKKNVIDYLLSEYAAGRTPNPDVMCNREIKFGVFYRFAKEHGADAVATGHYRSGEKDQSYFLWAVPKAILAETIFPVGDFDKKEVRALATRFGLPVARKKDSQGICFLGSVSVKDFLRQELGDDATLLHTVGERIVRDGEPWFVVGKDADTGELKIAKERSVTTGAQGIAFVNANWIENAEGELTAQYRYRGPVVHGAISGDAFITADLSEPVAVGQSLVFYRGGTLIGGGIIAA